MSTLTHARLLRQIWGWNWARAVWRAWLMRRTTVEWSVVASPRPHTVAKRKWKRGQRRGT